ncbi:MAG: LCP family protein [Saccharofermentanales bacterium]
MSRNNDFSNQDDYSFLDFDFQDPDYDTQSEKNDLPDRDVEMPSAGVTEAPAYREVETPLIREVKPSPQVEFAPERFRDTEELPQIQFEPQLYRDAEASPQVDFAPERFRDTEELPQHAVAPELYRDHEELPQHAVAPQPYRDSDYSNRANNVQPPQEPVNPALKAMEAARRAQEHANRAQMDAEREERIRRDQERSNIPLVSPRDRRQAAPGSKQEKAKQRPQANRTQRPQANRPQRPEYVMEGAEVNNSKRRRSSVNPNQPYPQRRNGSYQVDFYDEDDYPEEIAKVSIYGRIISVLLLLISLAAIAIFFIFNVLPIKYRLVITLIILLLNIIVLFLVSRGRFSRGSRIGGNVIGTISLILIGIICYFLFTTVRVLESMSISHETVTYDIRVMQDSPLEGLTDLNGHVLGVSGDEKDENITNAQNQISKQNNITFNITKTNGFVDNVNSLYAGGVDAILFNTSDYDSISSIYPDFEEETRILGTAEVMEQLLLKPNRVNTHKEGFSMYISGIDTYGELASVSRSDVNIIVTVNPQTKKILMTTIPRDSYVEIYGTNGGYDKLTHAGIYGIETSINTIANFLQTDINYYSRVNFTSLIELVDVLGGIEVENPYAFPTNDGRYYFEEGTIYLDGDQALAFSRERYNLPEGDIGRGRNQMRVIEAMINKVTRKENLANAASLLTRFNQFAETNMPTSDIMNLVNVSFSGDSWQIEKTDLAGSGRMDLPSYAMPGYQLYMYDPDPESAAAIRQAIEDTLNAK